ncbi:MAG: hypothetical protein ACM3OO_10815 [Planctomycetaceae bacterium]
MAHRPDDENGEGAPAQGALVGEVTPLRAIPVAPGPADEPRTAASTAVLAAVGVVAAVLETVRRALLAAAGRPDEEPADETSAPALLPAMVGASAAVVLASGRLAARAVDGATRAGGFAANLALGLGPPALRRQVDGVRARTVALDDAWHRERAEAEVAAGRVATALLPQVLEAVLDQLDLTAIVRERVDLDDVVAGVDIDAVIGRVDVQGIAEGLDIDAIATHVDVNRVAERIDLNRIAAGIDVDAVAERLDVERVLARLDLAAIATQVIDEIDLPEIIRSSTGAMASETVRGVRIQGIEADRAVERFVDRVIRRRARSTDVAESSGTAPSEQPPETGGRL